MRIAVTLPPDYLARAVTLRAVKAYKARDWRIAATDRNGWHTLVVTVDDAPAPQFKRRADALAYLATLDAPASIWAQPRFRRNPAPLNLLADGAYNYGRP